MQIFSDEFKQKMHEAFNRDTVKEIIKVGEYVTFLCFGAGVCNALRPKSTVKVVNALGEIGGDIMIGYCVDKFMDTDYPDIMADDIINAAIATKDTVKKIAKGRNKNAKSTSETSGLWDNYEEYGEGEESI